MDHPDRDIMREAIEYGLENHAVGAVVTREGKIIAKESGAIFERPDATAHSEIEAIRTVCKQRESHELAGCWLYTTFEPCPMCTSAAC